MNRLGLHLENFFDQTPVSYKRSDDFSSRKSMAKWLKDRGSTDSEMRQTLCLILIGGWHGVDFGGCIDSGGPRGFN